MSIVVVAKTANITHAQNAFGLVDSKWKLIRGMLYSYDSRVSQVRTAT